MSKDVTAVHKRSGTHVPDETFLHEALFYAGDRQFVERTSAFIRDGVRRGEPTLVVVDAAKIDMLVSELADDAGEVQFADMAGVGLNPNRIIPAWRDFVDSYAATGRPLRGVGEPIWAERTADALVECQRHEALLNVAFADSPPFRLACPYDTEALPADVIGEAHRSHPYVLDGHDRQPSEKYSGLEACAAAFDRPLPDPVVEPVRVLLREGCLSEVRDAVSRHAAGSGLGASRARDLVLAVNELATNSLRHGGGHGVLSLWQQDHALICEVSDNGYIAQPLIGRERPAPEQEDGFGLWLVNQLCDLVQLRTSPGGSVIRVHMYTSGHPELPS